ncbi:MAG: cytochrome c biogenesis protein ResB [Phycisphaerae bacterium]
MTYLNRPSSEGLSWLRAAGSLWLAAVLLSLISVAMACATVFESVHGSEKALAFFYKSWWFESLLGLLAINAGAALAVRYPFSRRQLGFAVAHGSLLLILAGAWVTQKFGIDGRVSIVEGQSVAEIAVPQDVFVLESESSRFWVEINPPPLLGAGTVEVPGQPAISAESVHAQVLQFTSDSVARTEMRNDNPHASLAVEVSFSETGTDEPVWVPAGQVVQAGEVQVACIEIADERELNKRTSTAAAAEEDAARTVKIEYQGKAYELNVDDCIAATQPVGDTGMTLRVLRYLPHATVAGRGQITNASNKPMNPAIEAELSGPEGIERRFAFARFPAFQSMHGNLKNEDVKLVLMAKVDEDVHAPVEILVGPGDQLHAKFTSGQDSLLQKLQAGMPLHTPWPQRKLGVSRIFKNARPHRIVSPSSHPHGQPHPAILVRLNSGQDNTEVWVQKYDDQPVVFAGRTYRLGYDDKTVPLGFEVALDAFRIRKYPGTDRPRSYESRITITDPASGRLESRVISMNHPTSYGGYTFYQSSYRQTGQHTASVLSVSRDPGKPIVFAGYGLMILGVLAVLIDRLRRTPGQASATVNRDGKEGA